MVRWDRWVHAALAVLAAKRGENREPVLAQDARARLEDLHGGESGVIRLAWAWAWRGVVAAWSWWWEWQPLHPLQQRVVGRPRTWPPTFKRIGVSSGTKLMPAARHSLSNLAVGGWAGR